MHAIRIFILALMVSFSFSSAFAEEVTPPQEPLATEALNNALIEAPKSDGESDSDNDESALGANESSSAISEVKEEILAELASPFLLDIKSDATTTLQRNVWQSIVPNLGYYVDEDGDYSISQISQSGISQFNKYSTFAFGETQGTSILYLEVPYFELKENEHVYIELGDRIQGKSQVWFKPTGGSLLSIPALPQSSNGNGYIVRDLAKGGELYIAIEGVPSLWFNPAMKVVASTSDIPTNGIHDSGAYKLYLLIALAVLSLLTFLRFLTEKGEWRFWASIFGVTALLLYYSGLPATPKGEVINSDLIPLFALAAMLFSIITLGRQIMSLANNAKGLNTIFLILSVVGVVLGLAPFSSSFVWLIRFSDIWQVLVIIILIPTFFLLVQNVRGSLSYFITLLSLIVGVAIGIYGIDMGLNSALYSLAPLAGVVLALFILLITPSFAEQKDASKRVSDSYSPDMDYKASDKDEERNLAMGSDSKQNSQALRSEKVKNHIISNHKEVEESAQVYYDDTSSFENAQTFSRIEQAFRVPLDSFMRELCFLEQQIDFVQGIENQNYKEKALVHTQTLLSVGKDINTLANSLPKMLLRKPASNTSKIPFNLQDVLRQVYEKVRYEAASSQIALSWFRSPHLGLWYVGDKNALATLLYQLLSDSIRATKQGIVYIRVERDETSNDYGRLLFTIGDSGHGNPPERRAASLLSKVWELSSAHDGAFKVLSNEDGTEYNFVLAFKALEDDGVTEKPIPSLSCAENPIHNPKLLLISAPEAFERHMLSFRLERMDFHVLESMDLEECLKQYQSTPAAVTVLGADYSLEDIGEFVLALREFENSHSLKATHIIALYANQSQENELLEAGCNFTLESNARRITFRNLVDRLVNDETEFDPQELESLEEDDSENQKQEIVSKPPQREILTSLSFNIDDSSSAPKSKSSSKKQKEETPNLKFALSLHADEDDSEETEEIVIKVNEDAREVEPFYIEHDKEVDLPSFIPKNKEEE